MVRVKICGITNMDDALHAAGCGADALGFIFYKKSPRYIDPLKAGNIVKELPPFITPVGVFVDEEKDKVWDTVLKSGVRIIQFHGSEDPDYCRSFGIRFVKAFRIKDEGDLAGMKKYSGAAGFLLDTYSEKEHGGTGNVFDWDIAVKAKKYGRILLAGGLNPENVADAVRKVAPYAVDVSSGVEAMKGKKDFEKMRDFIRKVKVL